MLVFYPSLQSPHLTSCAFNSTCSFSSVDCPQAIRLALAHYQRQLHVSGSWPMIFGLLAGRMKARPHSWVGTTYTPEFPWRIRLKSILFRTFTWDHTLVYLFSLLSCFSYSITGFFRKHFLNHLYINSDCRVCSEEAKLRHVHKYIHWYKTGIQIKLKPQSSSSETYIIPSHIPGLW